MDYAAKFGEFYSTALLADAAFQTGVPLGVAPPGLAPLAQRDKLAGPVVTVEANNDLLTIMAAVHRALCAGPPRALPRVPWITA